MSLTTTKHFLAGKKIIVAGGGVAGLSFAIALGKQWPSDGKDRPSVHIYERETRAVLAGREGYSMSLRSDHPGGIQALHKLGILDAMTDAAILAFDGKTKTGFCVWDKNWQPLLKLTSQPPPGCPVGGLRIARTKMRDVLIESVSNAGFDITWDTACTGVRRLDNGQFEVQLSNGSQDVCDLLVVADGARSKIRQQIRPNDDVVFQNICVIAGTSRFDGPPPEPLNNYWGMVTNGTGICLFASPVDERSALWSISWASDTPQERKRRPLPREDKDALLEEIRRRAVGFPPLFSTLLAATDEDTLMAFNAEDKQPFAHDESFWPGMIFVGDANHAVSPFAGNGANSALCDGWELAERLCNTTSLHEAVTSFDAAAIPRTTKVLSDSHRNIRVGHSEGWSNWGYMLFFRILGFFISSR